MKKLAFFLILVFVFSGCKKNAIPTPASPFEGNWVWYKQVSFIGGVKTPQSMGLTMSLLLDANNRFKMSGTYYPVGMGSYTFSNDTLRCKYDSSSWQPRFRYRFISKDTLELDSGSDHDSPIYYFAK